VNAAKSERGKKPAAQNIIVPSRRIVKQRLTATLGHRDDETGPPEEARQE
jgi:hypothetical protein